MEVEPRLAARSINAVGNSEASPCGVSSFRVPHHATDPKSLAQKPYHNQSNLARENNNTEVLLRWPNRCTTLGQ